MPTPSSPGPLLVACLCAEWCGSCREYRSTFDEAASAFPAHRFVWVDVEDDSDLVDAVDVDNFPTLLIADADGPRFFGPVLPHKETLLRLLRAMTETPSAAPATPANSNADSHTNADVIALAQRLRER